MRIPIAHDDLVLFCFVLYGNKLLTVILNLGSLEDSSLAVYSMLGFRVKHYLANKFSWRLMFWRDEALWLALSQLISQNLKLIVRLKMLGSLQIKRYKLDVLFNLKIRMALLFLTG